MVRIFIAFVLLVSSISCSENNTESCIDDSDCRDGRICDLDTSRCWYCEPSCASKCCGHDGCGGTCQDECTLVNTCNQTSCTCDPCIPNCDGKCCGDDGCGGNCPDECHLGDDCNQTSCACEPCIPNCTGKCCGDDGCGGTCPDECAGRGLACVPATCACSGAGQIGDPCPFEDFHLNMPHCDASEELFCYGFAANGNYGTCANGTAEECVASLPLFGLNPTCVDGACGSSYCTKKCKRLCDCCPDGSTPVENIEQIICWPGFVEYAAEICPFANVNSCFDDCGMGSSCVGTDPSPFYGLCPSGYSEECHKYLPETVHPDCIDGMCGLSFCAQRCPDGVCDWGDGYVPTELNGNCYCFPVPEPSSEGMRCKLGDVNELWGSCEPGLTCVGLPADGTNGQCPNGIPDCTHIPSSQNPYCHWETDFCGASFCATTCSHGVCAPGYVPFQFEGTCYCAPQ